MKVRKIYNIELLPRPHDKFIRERFSDMAKNIRDRRLDRPADEAIEMKTLEVKKEEEREEEEEVNSRDPIQLKNNQLVFLL